jgi:hypothetical protein
MVRNAHVAAVVGLGLLGACTRLVDDPLAVHSVYWGLSPNPVYRGELPQVLWSAPDTPAKQGLLYTAMVESEVASQYAGRARARLDDPGQVRSALGEVLYAIDPEQAPPWEAKSAGIVAGWAGRGYGVRRAVGNMAEQLRDQAGARSASPVLAEYGPRAAGCADNTLGRAEQVMTLGQQAFAAVPDAELEPLLEQLETLANELNRGAGVTHEEPCGLEQAKRYLDLLGPGPRQY